MRKGRPFTESGLLRGCGQGLALCETLTYLPSRPRSRNSTVPVTSANSVSSLPRPTFLPGLYRVPR